MNMTIIEKILSSHSDKKLVKPGDIVDVEIDTRVARDFGGANVVKNIRDNNLGIENVKKTFFTFDCNPTGSDQKYATNQHICRVFARDLGIRIYDINSGIGTHLLIEEGLVYPGCTAISTDSHANVLGAIGAFGQGMGDKDIAAAWSKGKIWFKVPKSVKINFQGNFPEDIFAKDIVLNLLSVFGANKLLGYSVEIYGDEVNRLSLDDRIPCDLKQSTACCLELPLPKFFSVIIISPGLAFFAKSSYPARLSNVYFPISLTSVIVR
ncbi:unnamed protein product [marine sediment metagenome]|uniref:Aconitase/3-isopropylmalate dehydratase large subunit alpha/beta/alpha domain-containing protein n=1 Tax=marine sediment metagenome TaxID=412755 RepID=X1HV50_9ZZZZ